MAMRYKVEIIETLTRTIFILATSKEEAESIIRHKYRDQEIVLSSNDYVSVEYHVQEDE
jgi:hypothetical protein